MKTKNTLTKAYRSLGLLVFVAIGSNTTQAQLSQTLLSESWTGVGGEGAVFYHNVTKTDDQRNVYVAGATMAGINNSDMIVQKFNRNGTLLWQQTYAGAAGMSDAAADMFIDGNYNVYVTGTVVNSVSHDQDIAVLKYNSSGDLHWTYFNHGSNTNVQDAGTAITSDNSTTIFVAGTSGDDANLFDYKTIALNMSDGSEQWVSTYDYTGLAEAPKKITYSSGTVTVVGASQESMSPIKWEMATVNYNATTGVQTGVVRSNSSSITGVEEINDVTWDASGNTYLVGALNNGTTGYDIAVYKLNNTLSLVWENFYDVNGLDDKGYGIKVDNSGNLYVTGFATKSGVGKEAVLMKLNSSGNASWTKQIGGGAGLDDRGEQLVLDDSGRIFVAASVNEKGNLDYRIYGFESDGTIITSAQFNGQNDLNDTPQAIAVDADGNIIVTGKEQINATTYKNKTVKYTLFDKDYNYVTENSVPIRLEGNILVRFRPNKINTTTIDKRNFYAGELHEFVDAGTLSAIQNKTGNDWSKLTTYKVFKNMTTADSLSITRLDDTIAMPSLWSLLSIDIPTNWNVLATCDSLDSLSEYVKYSSPNNLVELYDVPFDALYSNGQLGLYPNTTYPAADINVEDAWDLEVGQSDVKVGIIDGPLNWTHNEFNGDETNLPGPTQKIGGGRNYHISPYQPIYISDHNSTDPHGTSVAGIIGAKRNNYMPGNDSGAEGIAGIAGGAVNQGNFGVQLFSLVVSENNNFAPTSAVVQAFKDGYSDSPTNDNDFGLHLLNASWGNTLFPNPSIREQVEWCWKNHCIFVAARGHDTEDDDLNIPSWPACFDDLQVLNVIASGTNGERKTDQNGLGNWSSMYGLDGANNTTACDVDFMAPGTSELITTTGPSSTYNSFNGTSATAPHVTGVAALMYSQHQPVNGYPTKLATEDIENILQKTAVDKQTIGYDLETGYGLIDAHEAVTQVSDPYYVLHVTDNSSLTLLYDPVTVNFQDNDFLINNTSVTGNYPGSKKYVVNWDLHDYLPLGHIIIDWWDLRAADINGVGNGFGPSQTHILYNWSYLGSSAVFDPVGGSEYHFQGTTEIYYVNRPAGPFWYPVSPDQLKYYVSLHVKKNPDVGIEELHQGDFILYPNPSNSTIHIQSKSSANIKSIQVYDSMGRMVCEKYDVTGKETTINTLSLDIGMYYCNIISENSSETIPFVKSN